MHRLALRLPSFALLGLELPHFASTSIAFQVTGDPNVTPIELCATFELFLQLNGKFDCE